MSAPYPADAGGREPSDPEALSALFASLVIQHSNMALIFLGQVAHPETGQTYTDLEAARSFIDQLEMLEVKTKGNLSEQESGLLKQTLMNLHLVYVEAAEAASAKVQPSGPQSAPGIAPGAAPCASAPEGDEDQRKKFSKTY